MGLYPVVVVDRVDDTMIHTEKCKKCKKETPHQVKRSKIFGNHHLYKTCTKCDTKIHIFSDKSKPQPKWWDQYDPKKAKLEKANEKVCPTPRCGAVGIKIKTIIKTVFGAKHKYYQCSVCSRTWHVEMIKDAEEALTFYGCWATEGSPPIGMEECPKKTKFCESLHPEGTTCPMGYETGSLAKPIYPDMWKLKEDTYIWVGA